MKKILLIEDDTQLCMTIKEQLTKEIWEEEQRFSNPHIHYVDMSPKYYEMKMNLLSRLSLHSARNKGELND